jgi:hypothetical protein
MAASERTVSLKIDGDVALGGRVPIDVLAAKMKALQELVLAAAHVTKPIFRGESGGKAAQRKLRPREACRLLFSDIKKNCLTLEAELPPTSSPFPSEDWGVQAADTAVETLRAISGNDVQRLAEIAPDTQSRLRLVRKAQSLAPASSDHELSIKTPHQSVVLSAEVADRIKSMEAQFSQPTNTSDRTVQGRVFAIDIHSSPPRVELNCGSYFLTCELTPDVVARQVLGNLAAGTLVEVTGKAALTKNNRARKITEASSLRQLEQEPMRWTRLVYENREFVFHDELIIDVTGNEHGWVFKSKDLGLMGFATERQEALLAFRQDFAACWDNIAKADDRELTKDAIALKRSLKAFVKECGIIE